MIAPRVIESRRLYIFGGVYGNAAAFAAFLAAVEKSPAPMICTGDLAAYCADGAAVCQKARVLTGVLFVRGNCERTIAADEDDCDCGFDIGSQCEILSHAWHRHARNTIGASEKQWMGELPCVQKIIFGGRRLSIVHATHDSDNQFIFPSTAAATKQQAVKHLEADGVICGHSGIPFTEIANGTLWHNSGALGMPANDGTPRVWYSIWTTQDGGIRIEHVPLLYDTAAAQQSMRQCGLPDDYAHTLQNGIWPSNSILPPPERRRQGLELNPPPMRFMPD